MTTGKDYGLPEEYADWVEMSGLEIHIDTPDYLHLIARRFKHGPLNSGSLINDRYYIPPKPKPTLPEVKPGAVVRYTDRDGDVVRVMRTAYSKRPWTDLHENTYDDAALLADVNDDGFTIELGGLE